MSQDEEVKTVKVHFQASHNIVSPMFLNNNNLKYFLVFMYYNLIYSHFILLLHT